MSKRRKKRKSSSVKDWISPSEISFEDYDIDSPWELVYSPEKHDAEIIAQKELGFYSDEDLYDDFIGDEEVFRGSAFVVKWKDYYAFYFDAIEGIEDDECIFFYTDKDKALKKYNDCDEGEKPIIEQIQDCISAMNKISEKELPVWFNVKYKLWGYYFQLKYNYMLLADHANLDFLYFLNCIERFKTLENKLSSKGISISGIWKIKGEFKKGEANQRYYCFELTYKGEERVFVEHIKSMYQGQKRCTLDFFPSDKRIDQFISSVNNCLEHHT